MNYLNRLTNLLNKFKTIDDRLSSIESQNQVILSKLEHIQIALGRIESRQTKNSNEWSDIEFKVFSQWGEDGIIENLIQNMPFEQRIFIEFGVENFSESNCRFLLNHRNWSGLVIDGSDRNIQNIKNSQYYWQRDLKAISAFITKNNINQLIQNAGITGDIGILSVDIDGNDYWVWEAINCINPRIVICEYNSLFGPDRAITTIYDDKFVRTNAHYSNLFYGASISALNYLAEKKGYKLITSNSVGNNIFFVRNDIASKFKFQSPKEAYKQSKFRESRDQAGSLTFLSFEESQKLIRGLDVWDVINNVKVEF